MLLSSPNLHLFYFALLLVLLPQFELEFQVCDLVGFKVGDRDVGETDNLSWQQELLHYVSHLW